MATEEATLHRGRLVHPAALDHRLPARPATGAGARACRPWRQSSHPEPRRTSLRRHDVVTAKRGASRAGRQSPGRAGSRGGAATPPSPICGDGPCRRAGRGAGGSRRGASRCTCRGHCPGLHRGGASDPAASTKERDAPRTCGVHAQARVGRRTMVRHAGEASLGDPTSRGLNMRAVTFAAWAGAYRKAVPSAAKATSTAKGECQNGSALAFVSRSMALCCCISQRTTVSSIDLQSSPGEKPAARATCSSLRSVPPVAKPRSPCAVSSVSPAVWQMQHPSGCCVFLAPGRLHSAKRAALTHGGRCGGSAAQDGSGAALSSHMSWFSCVNPAEAV